MNIFYNLILWSNVVYNDAPQPWKLGFQDSASPAFTGIVELHNTIGFYLIVISVVVFWMLFIIIYNYKENKNPFPHKYLTHGTVLEIIWTITPALVLIAIAFPSFKLLYMMDEVIAPSLTMKVVGFFKNGLKSNILNKIKDTYNKKYMGQKSIISKNFYFKNNIIKSSNLFKPNLGLTLYTKNLSNLLIQYKLSGFFYSSKFFHTRCRAINRIGPHNLDVISLIIGLLLGDGYANNRTGEGTRIAIKQSILHKEYLFYLYQFFLTRGYCSNLEPRLYKRYIKGKNKIYYGYEFNTFTFRSLNWIYNLFYKKGKKILPKNIEKYFTPLTLAILICDDGCFTNPGIRISTNNFTLNEVEILLKLLKNKFNLDCTIQKIGIVNKYSIYIKGNSISNLNKIVLPYMQKSMYYKLGLSKL